MEAHSATVAHKKDTMALCTEHSLEEKTPQEIESDV